MSTDDDAPAPAVWLSPSELVPWDRNPRRNDAAVPEVVRSIKRYGFGAPVVARLADRRIIAGHTRVKAALELGLERIPVRLMDLDEDQAARLALEDNKTAEVA